MSQNVSHRHIHKITLNEQKVAQFLFELLRDNFIVPKRQEATDAKAPKEVKKPDTYAQLAKIAQTSFEFIHAHQHKEMDEKKVEVRLNQYVERLNNAEREPITLWEAIKTLFLIWTDALGIELIIATLNNEDTRTKLIRTLQGLSKVSFLIPFENFSLEKIVEKKFEKLIGELSSEADSYADKNYNISFNVITGFLASVAIIVSIVAYKFESGGVSDFFRNIISQPFYFWVLVIIGFVAAIFLGLILQNFYEKKKREYFIDMLNTVKDPLVNPELITHEYLLFIRDIMVKIRGL